MTLTANSLLPFSVYLITTLGGNSTFFWQGHGQKILPRVQQNTPFQVNNSFFFGRGPSPLPRLPLMGGTLSPHPTLRPIEPIGFASASLPQHSSEIYATV